jgi:hypothetical protein
MGCSTGFEPALTGSQPVMLTVTLRATFKVAAAVGNAPTYQVLQTRANLSQLSSVISGRRDSNSRPPAPKAGALPS